MPIPWALELNLVSEPALLLPDGTCADTMTVVPESACQMTSRQQSHKTSVFQEASVGIFFMNSPHAVTTVRVWALSLCMSRLRNKEIDFFKAINVVSGRSGCWTRSSVAVKTV